MNPLDELAAAIRGWVKMVRGRGDGRADFRATPAGAAVAGGYVLLALLLAVALQSMTGGVPQTGQVLLGLVFQAGAIVAMALAMQATLRFLLMDQSLLPLLVPALYALAFVFALAVPLSLFGPGPEFLVLPLYGYLLFVSAGAIGGMKLGIAAAFAVSSVLVLVVVPNALYMLVAFFTPT